MSVLIRVLVCYFCFVFCTANAGSFKVFPLKLNFDAKTQTQLFRINNTGTEAVTVQLDAKLWAQDKIGEDLFEITDDIIFFPKIVEVKQGEERVVRVAYRGSRSTNREKSYRLFAQELPNKSEVSSALSFALRFSVPVFVGSKIITPMVDLVSAEVKNGEVQLLVANRGDQHFIVSKIEAEGLSRDNDSLFLKQAKGWYVLPRSQRVFSIALDEQTCRLSSKVSNKISVGNKIITKVSYVDYSQCRKIIANDKNKVP